MKTASAAIGIAALSFLAYVAFAQGWADLLAFQGRAVIKAWDKRPQAFEAEAWTLAQSRLQRALQLDPGNPGIAEDLGRLHELRAFALPGIGPAAAASELRQALEYFRLSARARPTSPYTWANIAFMQSRLGVLDAEFYRSIENAATLGPWEPEVQLALADIGFRYWNRLPKATRDTIHQTIRRGLKRQDEKLFDRASRYGRLDVMCATPDVFRSKRALRCI